MVQKDWKLCFSECGKWVRSSLYTNPVIIYMHKCGMPNPYRSALRAIRQKDFELKAEIANP
jgi:hypothetical protein